MSLIILVVQLYQICLFIAFTSWLFCPCDLLVFFEHFLTFWHKMSHAHLGPPLFPPSPPQRFLGFYFCHSVSKLQKTSSPLFIYSPTPVFSGRSPPPPPLPSPWKLWAHPLALQSQGLSVFALAQDTSFPSRVISSVISSLPQTATLGWFNCSLICVSTALFAYLNYDGNLVLLCFGYISG